MSEEKCRDFKRLNSMLNKKKESLIFFMFELQSFIDVFCLFWSDQKFSNIHSSLNDDIHERRWRLVQHVSGCRRVEQHVSGCRWVEQHGRLNSGEVMRRFSQQLDMHDDTPKAQQRWSWQHDGDEQLERAQQRSWQLELKYTSSRRHECRLAGRLVCCGIESGSGMNVLLGSTWRLIQRGRWLVSQRSTHEARQLFWRVQHELEQCQPWQQRGRRTKSKSYTFWILIVLKSTVTILVILLEWYLLLEWFFFYTHFCALTYAHHKV